jgi:hypothetical protein
VPDEIFDEAAKHYDEAGLAALIISIAAINAWNRLNIISGQETGEWTAVGGLSCCSDLYPQKWPAAGTRRRGCRDEHSAAVESRTRGDIFTNAWNERI